MPRSNAWRMMALPFSNTSTEPKLCQRPSETAGSCKPLLPQRLYFMDSYRVGEGEYCIWIILGVINIKKNRRICRQAAFKRSNRQAAFQNSFFFMMLQAARRIERFPKFPGYLIKSPQIAGQNELSEDTSQ